MLWFNEIANIPLYRNEILTKLRTNNNNNSEKLDLCGLLSLPAPTIPTLALPPQPQCSPIYLLKQCDDQLKDCLEIATSTNLTIAQEVVIDLLAEAMSKESTGFLVDGFPATMEQVGFTRCYLAVFQIFDSPTIDYTGGINDTGQFFWVFPLSV